jgi:Ca2+:H+ antiporter
MAMADALSSLMIITATALILPTVLYSTFPPSEFSHPEARILSFSRGSAVVLIALYIMYLYFELKTHNYFFLGASNEGIIPSEERNLAEEHQEPKLSRWTATAVLLTATVGIMGCTHLLIDSVDETVKVTHITNTFIAAILIPIASNAPEGAIILVASRNGKVDFAIGVIVGSILQIALFVIPLLVILGWFIQQPMTLNFEPFQTIMLFLAVLVVNRLLQDGKYTYIQGAMLVAL